MQVQILIAAFIMQAALFISFGIFLERLKMRQQQAEKMSRKTDALYNQPKRVCGEFVWHDGKNNRSHHCVLTGDDHYIHRASNGMGRKTYA